MPAEEALRLGTGVPAGPAEHDGLRSVSLSHLPTIVGCVPGDPFMTCGGGWGGVFAQRFESSLFEFLWETPLQEIVFGGQLSLFFPPLSPVDTKHRSLAATIAKREGSDASVLQELVVHVLFFVSFPPSGSLVCLVGDEMCDVFLCAAGGGLQPRQQPPQLGGSALQAGARTQTEAAGKPPGGGGVPADGGEGEGVGMNVLLCGEHAHTAMLHANSKNSTPAHKMLKGGEKGVPRVVCYGRGDKLPVGMYTCVVNTTSRSQDARMRQLSPFLLGPCEAHPFGPQGMGRAHGSEEEALHVGNMENAWQFSKVYRAHADEEVRFFLGGERIVILTLCNA